MGSYTLKRESCWVSVFCVPILSSGEAVVELEGDANWLVTEWLTVLHSFSALSLSYVEMEGPENKLHPCWFLYPTLVENWPTTSCIATLRISVKAGFPTLPHCLGLQPSQALLPAWSWVELTLRADCWVPG